MLNYKTVPSISEPPVVGSLLAALTSDTKFRTEMRRQHPDISRFHVGPYTFVTVAEPGLCQEVLTRTEEFDKTPAVTAAARPAFGTGILLIENRPHRARRRLIQPAFNHSRIVTYADTISKHATERAQMWREGQVIDVGEEMIALTMRVIGKVMFDMDDLGEDKELGEAMTTTFEYMKTAFLLPVPLSWPLPHNIKMRKALDLLDQTIYSTLAQRKASTVGKGDLISLLLAARDEDGRQLTDEEIRDDAMAILVAGHETTAYSLAFAFYLLARHPAAYAKLQHEVQSVLQGRRPTYEDLARLPYTVQVFKETLRLFPAAHTLPRQATQDTTIGNYAVKKGWFVGVDIWGMHRRPDYFPDPKRFDPDRFTPKREAQIPRNAYLPFGSGPRNCIGRGLAMLEGPLALATLNQHARLELEPATRLKLKFLLTIRPRAPLMMRVHRS
jgi:cytochrome P450